MNESIVEQTEAGKPLRTRQALPGTETVHPAPPDGAGSPPRRPEVALADRNDDWQPKNARKAGKDAQPPGAGKGFTVESVDGQAMCLVSEYRGDGIKEFVVTATAAMRLDPNDVDYHIDEVHGRILIKTWDGRQLEHEEAIPLLGPVGRAFLDEIMRAPGQLLTAFYLAKNPRLPRIVEDWPRNALTLRLRRALGDTVVRNWHIYVAKRPWRIRWQRERSWRIIEPLAD